MTGKGDTYRPVDWDKWSENYDRIKWNVATSSAIESGRTPESYLEDRNGQAEKDRKAAE